MTEHNITHGAEPAPIRMLGVRDGMIVDSGIGGTWRMLTDREIFIVQHGVRLQHTEACCEIANPSGTLYMAIRVGN